MALCLQVARIQLCIWVWMCLMLPYCFVRCQYNANIVKGKQYPEDILIGRQTLLDNGGQVDSSISSYQVTLLATEGNMVNYNTSDGYFMGFQWVNTANPTSKHRINLQLYRKNSPEGAYTLLHQSGWVYCEAGLNIYYFNESITFDTVNSSSDYVIGFMIPPYAPEPVLHSDGYVEQCTSQMKSNSVLQAKLSDQPIPGQSISFKSSQTKLECPSYYIQGIFLKTHYASKNYGGCSMSVVHNDSSVYLVSQNPFPGSGYLSHQSMCQFVRLADPDNYRIHIKPQLFDFPDSDDCENGGVIIGDQDSLPGEYEQIKRGIYCGDKMFHKAHSRRYFRIDMIPGVNTAGHRGYKIRVEADYHSHNGIVFAIVGSVFSVVIVAVTLTCCCCCFCIAQGRLNKKRTLIPNSGVLVSPDGSVQQWAGGNTQQYPVMYNGVNYGATTPAMYGTTKQPLNDTTTQSPYFATNTTNHSINQEPPHYQDYPDTQPIV